MFSVLYINNGFILFGGCLDVGQAVRNHFTYKASWAKDRFESEISTIARLDSATKKWSKVGELVVIKLCVDLPREKRSYRSWYCILLYHILKTNIDMRCEIKSRVSILVIYQIGCEVNSCS